MAIGMIDTTVSKVYGMYLMIDEEKYKNFLAQTDCENKTEIAVERISKYDIHQTKLFTFEEFFTKLGFSKL